jgi:multimeric flavodoxin WrbA
MNILILTSSFRKKGNTAQIVDLLQQSIRDLWATKTDALEFETIDLAEQNIQHCRGCRVCFNKGETYCLYWEDIVAIKAVMRSADMFILASPVYVEDVNGVMKTFLDRLAHINHRPEFAGKYAYVLTTSGSGSSGHAVRTMVTTLRTWGVHIIGQRDFVSGALSSKEALSTRYQKPIEKIARQIVDTVEKKKTETPSFVSLLFFRIQQRSWQRHVEDSVDYHYWESRGWLERGATFYYPHKTNALNVAAARLTGNIISAFFE